MSSSSTFRPSPRTDLHQPTVTATAISNRTLLSALKGKTCAICLTQIAGHRSAILTNCLHAYCLRCLLRWSNHKRTCPLCISPFHSYFSSPSLSSPSFRFYRLLPLRSPPGHPRSAPAHSLPVQRVLRSTREEINAANRRSRTAPRRRSFGRIGSVSADVIQQRVSQWRASIYKCGLEAVPFPQRNLSQSGMMSNSLREEILRRIEPWIRRELQAVLQDPDPTVIVHVATSLYLSSIEKKTGVSVCADGDDTFLAPLRPFLLEWTNVFWHELRCFAESCFTMDTYDEVVQYRKSGDC